MSADYQSSIHSPQMQIHEVLGCATHSGNTGTGLIFKTNRGDVRSILHKGKLQRRASYGFVVLTVGLAAQLTESTRNLQSILLH